MITLTLVEDFVEESSLLHPEIIKDMILGLNKYIFSF